MRSAAVAVLALAGVVRWSAEVAAQVQRPDPTRWEGAMQAFAEQPAPSPGGVLFVGSSSIRLWDLAASFPGRPMINRGFGGSHLADVSHYVDRLVWPHCPCHIVIYAGDNDIAFGLGAEDVASDFRALVKRIRERVPCADIYYLSIKPSVARWEHYPTMNRANAMIRKWAERDGRLHFVDVATPMLTDDGQVRPELFVEDGLHLNAQGYEIWTRAVSAALSRQGA